MNNLIIIWAVFTGACGLITGFTIGWVIGLARGRKQVEEEQEIERNF